jgi:large subunit ribosomal protein L20
MSRVKRGLAAHKRHKKLLKQTKGFWGQRKNVYRRAHETLIRGLAFAFKGRRLKKRDMRALFISRIHAASNQHGMPYNRFMFGLKQAKVELNRKMLSQLAIFDPKAFAQLVQIAKG